MVQDREGDGLAIFDAESDAVPRQRVATGAVSMVGLVVLATAVVTAAVFLVKWTVIPVLWDVLEAITAHQI
ncbi:MAG: hypothetical protein ABIR17_01220 [Pseudolysinimonas sp.]|uniref:hypothetical protein n=1 Tax=Pseudolysinimonas sp. TaxID=2680009 RepID=UPI003263F3AA